MAEVIVSLSDALLKQLEQESFVLLSTVDAETGGPTTNAISWVYAVDNKTLRFAIDQRSRLIANVTQNPKVTISIFSEGSLHAVYGTSEVIASPLAEVPIKLVCIEVKVDTVRDAMFYGARISVMPAYEKTYDKRAADKLDGQVFAAMRKA
ncbi:pyridoxamine 5'-phosphate oxidase family protein [Paenibacillus guangzhouensis]|uniref:pyridoxamine 5'-phosphate oxidase family protein n=1 Tax=Paenibacillus guangzhouensis TaxID=1473112 RepID=UPI001266C37F|nr:pyridoxamine 5'-phosphate oxidase family protein [Paenibacillus guangzhouensis]